MVVQIMTIILSIKIILQVVYHQLEEISQFIRVSVGAHNQVVRRGRARAT